MENTLIQSRGTELESSARAVAWLEGLYEKYLLELKDLTEQMASLRKAGLFQGPCGTYDIQGELYYILVRERGASRILELGSAAGWSTFYLAAAAARNGMRQSVIHSFEIDPGNAALFRKNIEPRFPFVRLHEGDCRIEFLKPEVLEDAPFDFVLLDVHVKDFPQFAFREVLPKARGFVVVDDLVPDRYPRNHSESVFFLWLLIRGAIPFFPVATLLDQPGIQRLRADLVRRLDVIAGGDRHSAKGVLVWIDGVSLQSPFWKRQVQLRFDQFPPRGLEQYSDIPERFSSLPFKELWKEIIRRVVRKPRQAFRRIFSSQP